MRVLKEAYKLGIELVVEKALTSVGKKVVLLVDRMAE